MFDFLKKNLNNDKLITMFNMLKDNIYEFDGDILNMFYQEFTFWNNSANDASRGVVLTPHHIV